MDRHQRRCGPCSGDTNCESIVPDAVRSLLSGLMGTRGILLSPALLFMGWSATKTRPAVAAMFILCNSIAGHLGNVASVNSLRRLR
jgi:hypothetical protein